MLTLTTTITVTIIIIIIIISVVPIINTQNSPFAICSMLGILLLLLLLVYYYLLVSCSLIKYIII